MDPREAQEEKAGPGRDWFRMVPVGRVEAGETGDGALKRALDASETPWLILALLHTYWPVFKRRYKFRKALRGK